MAWTAIPAWGTNTLMTAADFDIIDGNLTYLLGRLKAHYTWSSDYTTTSSSFINVDRTNLSMAVPVITGESLVIVVDAPLVLRSDTADNAYFDITQNGTRIGDSTIGLKSFDEGSQLPMTLVRAIPGLSTGTYTFALQWKTSGGTLTLRKRGQMFIYGM